jgi:Flp pilus assembly protein TadD
MNPLSAFLQSALSRVSGSDLATETHFSVLGRLRLNIYLRKEWLRCLILGIVGFVVRVPALQGQLIWDDDYLVRTNPIIKSPLLILEVFRHYLFLDSYSTHYRPVQNISYMADYFLWNTNFYGYHLTSILFHIGSGILLYLLLRKLFGPLLTNPAAKAAELPAEAPRDAGALSAFIIALLWVVHPVHSAAVDYLSGRADCLAFFFACAAWLLFLKAREFRSRIPRSILFSLAGLSGLLGLCSRETAAIWVIVFLFHLFVFEKRIRGRQRLSVLAACLLIVGGYMALRQLPGARPVIGPSSDWPPSLRAVLMLRALGDYGRLMVFPSNLHMERTVFNPATFRSDVVRGDWIQLEYLSIAGLALATALLSLAFWRGNGRRVRIFGAAWFIFAFLPISNLIELNATVAEHWLYLPSAGFLIFLAGCAIDFPRRWRRACVVFAVAAIVSLGARSFVRSGDWMSNETFARHTIRSGGATVRIALLLAQTFSNRGDYAEAEKILRKALQMTPDYLIARNNLADALSRQGKEKEAEALFAEATHAAHESMKEYPRTWIAALNFANLLHTKHDEVGAIAVLEKARRDYPQTWELISSEAELLRETNKLDTAVALVRPFAETHQWHYGAWIALGRAFAEKGDVEAAESALRHASWLDIHETAALNLMVVIRMGQNRLDDAWQTQRRAVSRQPDEPRQYILLSNILDKMGRADDSRAALAHVSRLRSLADSQKFTKQL